MTKMKDNQILITDDKGKETLWNILFTFEDEENHKNYVFFYNPEHDVDAFAMIYKEETGELFDIEDQEEFDRINEVYKAYLDSLEIENAKKNNN